MEHSETFITNYQIINENDHLFNVVNPTKHSLFIYYFPIILFFWLFARTNTLMGFIAIIIFIVWYISIPRLWNKIVKKFIQTNILHLLTQYSLNKEQSENQTPNFLKKVSLKEKMKKGYNDSTFYN